HPAVKAGKIPQRIFKMNVSSTTGKGSISGRVWGLDEKSRYNAYIEAFTADSIATEYCKGLAMVDSNYSYQIDSLSAGNYYVVAWTEGFEFIYFENAVEPSRAKQVTVYENEVTQNIDIQMIKIVPGTGSISGVVVNEKDDAPIADAYISVFSTDNYRDYGWATSDKEGRYQVPSLKSGNYVVQVRTEGYLHEFYDNVQTVEEATLVEVVEPNETANINFKLNAGGVIEGNVTNSNGQPLAGVYLQAMIFRPDSMIIDPDKPIPIELIGVSKGVTDENGNYAILGLPDGKYFVLAEFWSEWFSEMKFYDNVIDPKDATPVAVKIGETVKGINFQLDIKIADGIIAGRVVDLNEKPIANAYIQVQSVPVSPDDRSTVWTSTVTDFDGNYRIERLPAGNYWVSVWAQVGWQYIQRWWPDADTQENAKIIVISDEMSPDPINFKLPVTSGNAVITGTVTSSEGEPLVGANIQIYQIVPSPRSDKLVTAIRAYGYTDSAGFYAVKGLPAGSYYAQATHWLDTQFGQQWYENADSEETATPIVLIDGEERAKIDFSLNMRPMYGTITGTVTDTLTGQPISRAYVEIHPNNKDFAQISYRPFRYYRMHAITDEKGRYQFDWLWEGNYLISVYANGAFEYYKDAVVAEQATPVKVIGGETSAADFILNPRNEGSGSIQGRVVTDWESTPFEVAVVIARPAITVLVWPQSEMFYTTVADSNGYYDLKGLPPGEYYVMSFAPWTIGKYYDDVYDPAEATLVKVDGISPTNGIDFKLPVLRFLKYDNGFREMIGGGSVTGTVNDADGKPVAAATIYVFNESNEPVSFARTGADGQFQIIGLPPGNYILQASKIGYQSQFNGNAANFSESVPLQLNNGNAEVNFKLSLTNSTGLPDANSSSVPKTVELYGNYPNPFNPETRIIFALPQTMTVKLRIYNVFGEEVVQLKDGVLSAGQHTVVWDSRNRNGQPAASGLYFYQLQTEKISLTGKMLLMR
ncbi:carboxypeptidase regulatory-like domain-containing protein, partial [candidate division KSB1 bacterium]|nr:carboxypeptidase regulatory-like domain-containing protein [candidate division KSB1 bacterium]